jgi:glycine oxidase
LIEALRRCGERCGVRVHAERVTGLDTLDHDRIVLAAGAASARLWPGLPVRPVKGEILRLRQRPGTPPPPRHVVRARVHGRPLYLVPRAQGLVVGATQYEAGFDTAVTVAGVRDLIADAEAVLPALGEYELAEAAAGSRPCTPDNLPLIGRLTERVLVATGHGRNGVLGVPITADAVLALLAGDVLPEAKAADPQRFPQISSGGGR